MAVISTSNHPKALWPGIKKWFHTQYERHPLECMELFETVSSDKAYEERVQSVGYGLAAEKAQGSAISYDVDQQGYVQRSRNVTYALGYAVTMEEIADNQYAELAQARSGRLADSFRQTKEINGANIFNRGFNSAYVGGDGKELFAEDHPTMYAGNQSNELGTPADLSEASLEDLLIQIGNAKDDRGFQIKLMPRKLVISTNEQFNAERILNSTLQNDTANNATNALRSKGMLPEGYVVNHYLSDTDAFFILNDVPSGTGLIYQERMALEFDRDNDFNTKNALASAVERYKFDWVDWRAVYASAGAA